MKRRLHVVFGSLSRRSALRGAAAAVGLALLQCTATYVKWESRKRVPGYALPTKIPLVVDVSEQVLAGDEGGFVDTMVLVVQADLREHGVETEILSPKPSRLPLPRLEIMVRTWDEGSWGERYVSERVVGVPVVGSAQTVVTCNALSARNELMFTGNLAGHHPGSNLRMMAEKTGHEIAEALAKNN